MTLFLLKCAGSSFIVHTLSGQDGTKLTAGSQPGLTVRSREGAMQRGRHMGWLQLNPSYPPQQWVHIHTQRELLPGIPAAQHCKGWRGRSIHGRLGLRNIRLCNQMHLACIMFAWFCFLFCFVL